MEGYFCINILMTCSQPGHTKQKIEKTRPTVFLPTLFPNQQMIKSFPSPLNSAQLFQRLFFGFCHL